MSSSLFLRAGETAHDAHPPRIEAEDAPLAPADKGLAAMAAGGTIRALAPHDIDAVAALFQRSFRNAGDAAPDSLRRYLDELFLHHPCADSELPSRVHVGPDGAVNGFIGVLPAPMRFRGRPLRAAIAGSLMVADPQRDPLAGARLMRAFFKGPQDLSFSETANPLSQGMWERLGGFAAPVYSMEWVRVLRPFATSVAALATAAPAASLLRPLAWGLDRLAAPLTARVFGAPAPGPAWGADVGDDEIVQAAPELISGFALGPNWDGETLRWVLAHARRKERHGPLFRRMVTGRGGRSLGCYLYFGRPDRIAWVLQILARPEGVGPVIDDLFAHAAGQGCAAVRGRSNPLVLDALLRRKCLMLHRASTVVHARDPELLQAVRCGEAMLNGLAGESWTRLIGGDFA
jgi:hypothetical protein